MVIGAQKSDMKVLYVPYARMFRMTVSYPEGFKLFGPELCCATLNFDVGAEVMFRL